MDKLGYTFYPKDYISDPDVMMMTPTQRGIYRDLIDLAYMSDNCIKYNLMQLSKYCNAEVEDVEDILNLKGLKIGEYWTIPSCNKRIDKAKVNRENGSKGGRPPKPKNNPTNIPTNNPNETQTERQREREREREIKKENIIPMSGKPDDVKEDSKDSEITTITEKWITYINSIFAKKYTSASWSKKIEPNIKKLLKAYGDKSKLSDNFKIVTKNILQDTFHIENNYRYVTPEYVSRLAVFDRFLNIEASQNNGRWRHPSDIVMCSDWIKKIPQPPNPLDVEACEQFCTDWKIAQLRTYQYEKTGYTNMIHDYEP